QLISYLNQVYSLFKRPMWVTEWNDGASWCTPLPADYNAEAAALTNFVTALENSPIVERYAIYSYWSGTAGTNLQLATGSGSGTLTPAGVAYMNLPSKVAYTQVWPPGSGRGIAQFHFETNMLDSSGYGNNGFAVADPNYVAGQVGHAVALDGTNSYVQLPVNMAKANAFTFAAWVYWNGGANWQRIFDFGNDTTQYMFLTPSSGSGTLRFSITTNGPGAEQQLNTSALTPGTWKHVAVTLNGNTALLYVNGIQAPSSTGFSIAPAAFTPINDYLGKSQFSADPLFNGKLEEVEIADYAMTAAQISLLYNGAQYPPYAGGIWIQDANGNWGTSNNWSSGLIANGVSFIADFSTINITAYRTVTLDSARTIGGLKFGDTSGSQNWTLGGGNTLTLDAGSTNVATIAVNQNTATISTPLAGSYGFNKTGQGTLTLTGTNIFGGGLSVNAGSVSISGGSTSFGNGTSTIGYLTGSGSLTMTGGSLAMGGELRVGGSDQAGTQYNAAGAVTLANATMSVG